jgi:MFS transporter, PPP family, 3-phenylpropionic acid transporter
MFAPVFPLTECFGVDGAQVHGLDYGRLRLWASISFLAGSLISGFLLTMLEPSMAVWLIAAAQALSFFSTLLLPDDAVQTKLPESAPETISSGWQLFIASSFPLLIVAAGLGQASHAMLYTASSLHWNKLGYSSFDIGVFWTCAVTAEVVLFAYSGKVIEKFGPANIMLIGLAGGIVRWMIMASFTSYGAVLFGQTLHVLSFAATHLSTMHFIRIMTPPHLRNRAQGLYSAIASGVLMSSVAWASGHLYRAYDGYAYFGMGAVSVLALVLTIVLLRFSPRVRAAGAA